MTTQISVFKLSALAVIVLQAGDATANNVRGDFNGDGFADVAVSSIGVTVNDHYASGGIEVFYGAKSGLSGSPTSFDQDSPGMPGQSGDGHRFGIAMASGDFNGDGFSELAIGASDFAGGTLNAGSVTVLRGSAKGLSTSVAQRWHENSPGISGFAENGNLFGSSLAVGDFNLDGYDDLVIGVPYDDTPFKKNDDAASSAGSIRVLYGSREGLTAGGSQHFDQSSPGVDPVVQHNAFFGASFAVGRFNNDKYEDLAIGAHGDGPNNAGSVYVLAGGPSGLTTTSDRYFHQNTPGIDGLAEEGDRFGHTLTAADLNHDGLDDLVVGNNRKDVFGAQDAGTATLFWGHPTQLISFVDEVVYSQSPADLTAGGIGSGGFQIEQNQAYLSGIAEAFDNFGQTHCAGDMDGDGYLELAISHPREDWPDSVDVEDDEPGYNSGGITILFGTNGGPTVVGQQVRNTYDIGSQYAWNGHEWLGSRLVCADVNGDGYDDLIASMPHEFDLLNDKYTGEHQSSVSYGSFMLIYGSKSGPIAAPKFYSSSRPWAVTADAFFGSEIASH